MKTQAGGCPPEEDLGALFDGEAGPATERLQGHVAACPHCEARMLAFGQVRCQLAPLKEGVLAPGISEAVLLRLPRAPRPRPRRWLPAWLGGSGLPQSGTRVLGGVAALAAGAALGLSLVVGGAVADRTGMSVFAAEPAGQLCAGLPACGR